MKRSSGILGSFAAGARKLWSSQRSRQRSVLLALAVLAPACNNGGGNTPIILPTPGTIGYQQAVFTVLENGVAGTATITLTRSGGVGAVSVNYATSDGSAVSGTDYTGTSGTISWANGDTANKTFTVAITDDGTVEGTETVLLTLSLPTGGAILGQAAAVLNITDDDAPAAGVVQFDSATYTVGEGTSTATFTVTRTGGTAGAASVNWSIPAGGTATAVTDYTATPATLNWAAGESASKTFSITIVNDFVAEPTETVNLLLSGVVGASLGTTSTAVLTILDNDSPATLQFSTGTYNVVESGFSATITVTRTGGVGGIVGVTYATTAGGTATSGNDYTATTSTLSWGDGDSSSKTFVVFIADDAAVEGDETVNLTLSAPTGGAVLGTAAATLNILDDDCTLQFTLATQNIPEATGTATFTVSRVGSTLGAVSVDFSNPAGTATAVTDYTFAAGTLAWPIGDGANKTISIPIISDSAAEGNETLNLLLANAGGVGAHLGTQITHAGTIVDDDVQFTFAATAINVPENAGTVSITVNRVGASVGVATVTYTALNGTAGPADYTAGAPTLLTWADGITAPITFTIPVTSDTLAELNETFDVQLSLPTLAGGNATIGGTNPAVVTIVDDDTNVQFSSATYSGAENAGAITVTVTRTGLTTGASTVTWSIPAGGTAVAGDYSATPGVLTFAAGDTSKTFTITPVNDPTVEGSETLNLLLASPTPAGTTVGAQSTAVLTILDDDVPNATINDVSVVEGNAGTVNLTFTITLSAAPVVAGSVTVNTANGTTNPATAGTDYTAIVGQVVPFGIGVTTMPVTVVVNGDTTDEVNETLFVNLSAPVNLNITDNQGVGTITNDDDPTIAIVDASTTEGNVGTKLLGFTVNLSAPSLQDVVVSYNTANGTAVAPGDYTAVVAGSLTILAGNTTGTINITLNGDTTDEANETFVVNLTGATNTASITDNQATGTITNDDNPTITIGNVTAAEGTGGTTNFSFPLTLSAVSLENVVVTYSTADGSATQPGDYTQVIGGTVTINAGQTTGAIVISVSPDAIDEVNETFNVNITNVTNATVSGPATATGTITDDDGPTISITDVIVTEGTGAGTTNAVFDVTLSATSPQTVTVQYQTNTNTAISGTDFTAHPTTTLTFAPGVTLQQVTVVVTRDAVDEANESFFVDLFNPSNATILDNQGVGVIQDDDGPNITINDVSIAEGTGGATTAFTFTVSLSAISPQNVSVTCITADGTAFAPGDYTAVGAVVTILAGNTSAPFTVQVPHDAVDEVNKTFFVNLTAPVNGVITDNQGIGTIIDDDGPTITINNVAQPEGNVANNMVFTVTLSGISVQDVSVNYTTVNGSAIAGADYTTTTGVLTILAGQTFGTIPVPILGDSVGEPDENFAVNLSNAVNGQITVPQGVGTIQNDDAPSITINDNSVTEGNVGTTPLQFTVTLSNTWGANVNINWSTAPGTASTPADFQTNAGVLTILAGQVTGNITVQVVGDLASESSETFFVNLTGTDVGTITDNQGQGTINDDDGPNITITDVTNAEGNGGGTTNFVFNVNLSFAVGSTTTINYSTSDNTAASPSDYTAVIGGVLNIAAGLTSGTITIQVNRDGTHEPDETFNVNLTGTSFGTITDNQGVGTITNDDPVPTISIADVTQAEGNSGTTPFQFFVSLSNASYQTITFDYSIADGTATLANNDYIGGGGIGVNLNPGTVGMFVTVNVVGDTTPEPNETFLVNITNLVNAAPLDLQAQGTITSDDGPLISSTDPPNQLAPTVNNDTNLVITFNMPMVKTDVETRFTLAPATGGTHQFFWDTPGGNLNGTILTVVFDVIAPVGTITGDDTLPDDTTYTWTIANGAQSQSGMTLALQTGQFKTKLDTTSPTVTSITPNPAAAVLSNVTQFVLVFNEAMSTNTGSGEVRVESKSQQFQASVGNPSADMTVNWTNSTTLTIAFTAALASNTGFRMEIWSLIDAAGNGNNNNLNYDIVTSSNKVNPPQVTGTLPTNGATGVNRDTSVFIAVNELISPDVETKIQISPVTPVIIQYEAGGNGPKGVQITPKTAWPASTPITITIPGGGGGGAVTNSSGVPFAANQVLTFTTGATGVTTNPINIDAAFSTLKDAMVDCASYSGAQGEIVFKDSVTGAKAYLNANTLTSSCFSVTDPNGVPVKNFMVEASNWDPGRSLAIRRRSNQGTTSLQFNTTYTLTLKNTITASTGQAFAQQVYTFTTVPNQNTLSRPEPNFGDSRGQTSVGPPNPTRTVELSSWINSGTYAGHVSAVAAAAAGNTDYTISGGLAGWVTGGAVVKITDCTQAANNGTFTVVSVTGAGPYTVRLNNPAGVLEASPPANAQIGPPIGIAVADVTGGGNTFATTLTQSPGSGNFEYQSGGNEVTITTSDIHKFRYTITDGVGSHTHTVDENLYFFTAADMSAQTLNAPTAGANPTYSWNNAAPATATALFVVVKDGVTGDELFQWVVAPTVTSFTQPANYPLPAGSYKWQLGYFHAMDGTIRGDGGEGQLNAVSFTR